MRTLLKAFRLDHRDRKLLLRAFTEVAHAWLTVRLLPASAVLKKVSAKLPLLAPEYPQTAARIAWAIAAAARYIPGSKCLVQAIAGRNLLARYGVASQTHIGVVKDSKNWLSAHAWVEVQGHALIGGDVTEYAPLIGGGQEYSQ